MNRALLDSIADDDLKRLIRDEARQPLATQRRLNEHLATLLTSRLREARFLIVKQIELIFAYELELTVFRTCATNDKHILLLLPGERRGDRITLFHEAEARFQRTLPDNRVVSSCEMSESAAIRLATEVAPEAPAPTQYTSVQTDARRGGAPQERLTTRHGLTEERIGAICQTGRFAAWLGLSRLRGSQRCPRGNFSCMCAV